jgi:hypothetical protein
MNSSADRNPAIMEQHIGLEVSFCSRNARRKRLKGIFNSTTMRNWLEICQTNNEPFKCEEKFWEAMASRDPRAFRDLYLKHREWRQDLGQLVAWGLEGLRHSTVEEDGTLRVLWMPQSDKKIRIKIKHNPHSWTSFLRDDVDKCTFGIMSGKCLVSDCKLTAACQARRPQSMRFGYSVLETALIVNKYAPLPRGLEEKRHNSERKEKHYVRWSLSNVKRGEKFMLREGRLEVIEPFARTRLLVQWESGVARMLHEAKQGIFSRVASVAGSHVERYHWELREDDEWEAKPVPLFILSQHEYRR